MRTLVRVAIILCSLPSLAWALTPDANVQVSTDAFDPSVGMDQYGRTLLGWTATGQSEGGGAGTYVQRFGSDGAALAPVERIDSIPDLSVYQLADFRVTVAGDGRFVTLTSSDGGEMTVGCFNADGTLRVPRTVLDLSQMPRTIWSMGAVNASGQFVLAGISQEGTQYYELGIRAQRFDSSCTAIGAPIQVLPPSSSSDVHADLSGVVVDDGGNFEVVWQTFDNNDFTSSVQFQRYGASGSPIGGPVTVVAPAQHLYYASVASNRHGDFIIGWAQTQPGAVLTSYPTSLKRFDRLGHVVDPQPFVLSSPVFAYRGGLAIDDDGDVMLAWAENYSYQNCGGIDVGCNTYFQNYAVFGLRLAGGASSLTALGQPFAVAPLDSFASGAAVARPAADGGGNLSIVWSSYIPERFALSTGPLYIRHFHQDVQNGRVSVTTSGAHYSATPVAGGPAGTYAFNAQFCNSGLTSIANLSSRTAKLSNGNTLVNRARDGSPAGGVGSSLDFPKTGALADGVLARGECATVPYVIGLASRTPFNFAIDVLGDQGNEPTKVGTLLKAPAPIALPAATTAP
jgi:hypothetical protein